MNTTECVEELGPSCPKCGADTRKQGAPAAADGGEQSYGLVGEIVWACFGCGLRFEDEVLRRRNDASRASALRVLAHVRQLLRGPGIGHKA